PAAPAPGTQTRGSSSPRGRLGESSAVRLCSSPFPRHGRLPALDFRPDRGQCRLGQATQFRPDLRCGTRPSPSSRAPSHVPPVGGVGNWRFHLVPRCSHALVVLFLPYNPTFPNYFH